jgi:hypothetical protein
MDPGYRITKTLDFVYQKLAKKSSFFQKYPKHKRSSRLCLIAAERDSLKDLNEKKNTSLDTKNSKNIQILNFPLDSDFPIEYKVDPSQKASKDLSLGKIVINKSSRIRDGGDSPKNILQSEMFPLNHSSKDRQNIYWTKNRTRERRDDISDHNVGYSTLDRSRVIEVSYFPTNQNVTIFGDIDSTPKKFFKEVTPSGRNTPPIADIKYPLTPRIQKTSLSDFSNGSDTKIQDFLDRQIQIKLQEKKYPSNSENFQVKKNLASMTLSVEDDQSQNLCSLKNQDEKERTGFTFNIFDNKNIVKSEIFDTNKRDHLYLNFDSQKQDFKSNFFMTKVEEKNLNKTKKKHKKDKSRGIKKTKASGKSKLCKTPKREKFSKRFKMKSKKQIVNSKRSVKSNIKIEKKKKGRKKLGLTRHSVHLQTNQSIKESFKLKISKNKKKLIKKEKQLGLKEHRKTLPVNTLNSKKLVSSRQFKRSGLRHKRTMSGVTGMVRALVITKKPKDKISIKTPQKIQPEKSLYLKKQKSKSIRNYPKKSLRIKVDKGARVKLSKKKINLIETPIFKESLKKLTFDQIG